MAVDANEQRMLFEARRNLSSFGIETQFTARGDALRGQVTTEVGLSLVNPLGGPAIDTLVFTVSGDGRMRIDQPDALHGVVGPNLVRMRSVAMISEALQEAVNQRAAAVRGQAVRMRTLGLDIEIDAEGLTLLARVDLEHLGIAVLASDGRRLVARELMSRDGAERQPFEDLPVELDDFSDRVDLELFLSTHAERIAPSRASDALVISGHHASSMREIVFDAEADDDEMRALVAGLQPPTPGDVWVMHVTVDSDDGEEVRYRPMNIAGQAFGAPRVLPRIAFEAAYHEGPDGYRMAVQVAEVDDKDVGYVKLDRRRDPGGPIRTVSLVVFLANFTSEASRR